MSKQFFGRLSPGYRRLKNLTSARNSSKCLQMADCCSQTAVAQESALPDISLIIYAIFDRSEENEDGCSSKISEHWERKPRQVPGHPEYRSGGGPCAVRWHLLWIYWGDKHIEVGLGCQGVLRIQWRVKPASVRILMEAASASFTVSFTDCIRFWALWTNIFVAWVRGKERKMLVTFYMTLLLCSNTVITLVTTLYLYQCFPYIHLAATAHRW